MNQSYTDNDDNFSLLSSVLWLCYYQEDPIDNAYSNSTSSTIIVIHCSAHRGSIHS